MSLAVQTGAVRDAATAVRGRGEAFHRARAAVSETCARGADAAGHEHVAAGLAEFAACWVPALGLLGETAGVLADHLVAAAGSYDATEQANAGGMRAQ